MKKRSPEIDVKTMFCVILALVIGKASLFANPASEIVFTGSPKTNPWPTILGDSSCTNRSCYPGPSKGIQTAKWTLPNGYFSTPALISQTGDIFVGSSLGILWFNRKLEPKGEPLQIGSFVHSIALSRDGSLLAVNNRGAFQIREGVPRCLIGPGDGLYKNGIIGIIEAPDGNLLIWDSSTLSKCSPDGKILWSREPGKKIGMTGTPRVAVNKGGQVICGMASSYSGEDDPTEYFGSLVVYNQGGVIIWEKERNKDNLPTDTGMNLRIHATGEGICMAESGIAWFTPAGKELWRIKGYFASRSAVRADGGLIFSRDRSIQQVDSSSGKFKEVFQACGYPSQITLDSQNNLFVLSEKTLECRTEAGKRLFTLEGIQGRHLSIGRGVAILIERTGIISCIE